MARLDHTSPGTALRTLSSTDHTAPVIGQQTGLLWIKDDWSTEFMDAGPAWDRLSRHLLERHVRNVRPVARMLEG